MMQIEIAQLTSFYHPKLRQVLRWLEKDSGLIFRITSQLRPGQGGIHDTLKLRANDLGCHWEEVGKAIEKRINKAFIYDPQRPRMKVCVFHGPEVGNPWHLHIQVHPRTRRR